MRGNDDSWCYSAQSNVFSCLKALLTHLDEQPSMYMQILRRRKQEEIENSGLLSFLKVSADDYSFCVKSVGDVTNMPTGWFAEVIHINMLS